MSNCTRLQVIIDGYKKSFPESGYEMVDRFINQFPKEFLMDIERYLVHTNQSQVTLTFRLGEKELKNKESYMDFRLLNKKDDDAKDEDGTLPF